MGEEAAAAAAVQVPEMLTVKEAGRILHIPDSTVRELLYAGAFEHIRAGRRLLILQTSLVEWVEASKRRGMAVTGRPDHIEVVPLHGRRNSQAAG